MKAAWEELGSAYEASSSVVIGDVDCTVHQDLCQKHGVNGYPTIKYWVSGEGPKDYQGGRTLADLKKFADETLDVVKCSIDDPSNTGCSDREIEYLSKQKAVSADERAKALKRLEEMAATGKMKPDLKVWIGQRLRILQQLAEKDA